jgi:hypothetical protein
MPSTFTIQLIFLLPLCSNWVVHCLGSVQKLYMNHPNGCVHICTWCWSWSYCYTSTDMTACWSDSISLAPVQPLTLNTTCPPFPPSPPSGPAVSLDHSWRNEIAPSPPFPPIARTLHASTKCCGWNEYVLSYLFTAMQSTVHFKATSLY